MQSKNSLIVRNNIQEYIAQILEQNDATHDQLNKISELIQSREDTLRSLIVGFEELLEEHEKTHPKNKQWHKTLKIAKQYSRDDISEREKI